MENIDEINLKDFDMDHRMIETKRRKYIDCYVEPFRKIMEKIVYGVEHVTFGEFKRQLYKLGDILMSLKNKNDIYVLLLNIPEGTIRDDNYAKSNFWTANLLSLNIIDGLDAIIEINKDNIEDVERYINVIKYTIENLSDKQIVFITTDDCSYSGAQIMDTNTLCESVTRLNDKPNQIVHIVPYILKKTLLNSLKKDNRFEIIYNEIQKNICKINSVKNIVEKNIELYNVCMKCVEDGRSNELLNKYKKPISMKILAYIKKVSVEDITEDYYEDVKHELSIIINKLNNIRNFSLPYDFLETHKDLLKLTQKDYNLRKLLASLDPYVQFVKLESDVRYLLYFDFTFADNVSNNRQLISGVILGDEYYNYLNFDMLSEEEKNRGQVTYINNCDLNYSDTINCPNTYYKNILYNVMGTKINIKEISSIITSGHEGNFFVYLRHTYNKQSIA